MTRRNDKQSTGNSVVTMAPAPGDLFVVSTVDGHRVSLHPIDQHDRAVAEARAFALRWRGARPVVVKVFCVTVEEGQRMGFIPLNLFADQTPEQVEACRMQAMQSMSKVMRTSRDQALRAEAERLARQLVAARPEGW